MKKSIFIIAAILLVFTFGWIVCTQKYTIVDNENSIKKAIINKITKNSVTPYNKIVIRNMAEIKNKKIVYYTLESKEKILLGDAMLTKGINKKYKLDFCGYGTNLTESRIIDIKKSRYLYVMSRNYNRMIKRLKVFVEGYEVLIDVPDDEYFIVFTNIESSMRNGSVDKILFYDSYDNNITKQIYTKFREEYKK